MNSLKENTLVRPAPSTRLHRYITYFLFLATFGLGLKISDSLKEHYTAKTAASNQAAIAWAKQFPDVERCDQIKPEKNKKDDNFESKYPDACVDPTTGKIAGVYLRDPKR